MGFPRAALADPLTRIPAEQEAKLLQLAVNQTHDPLFGLHMGERVRPNSTGALGYAVMSGSTLREAVELLMKYEKFRSELGEYALEEEEDTFSIVWTPVSGDAEANRHRVESAFSMWVNFGRWVTRTLNNPLEVQFQHRAPDIEISEYHRIFNCPVYFDSRQSRIILDKRLLDLPLADADDEVHRVMSQRVDHLLANHLARGSFLANVRLAIENDLAEGSPSLESLAERLNMRPWTLRRRLGSEGADYSALLDQCRIDLATRYLSSSNRPITEIASALGYSEQSAFNRAFKRWFNCTPAAYRARSGCSGKQHRG